jgi:hypothetical protein
MKFILDENQEDRDIELSKILSIPLDEVKRYEICSQEAIRIYQGENTPENIIELYKDYKFLNIIAYYRTLMKTSVERRHKNLLKLLRHAKNKICLDFGSGVGTHTIALMQNNNTVDLLDVDGPLLSFTLQRINFRFGETKGNSCKVYLHDEDIPKNFMILFSALTCLNMSQIR